VFFSGTTKNPAGILCCSAHVRTNLFDGRTSYVPGMDWHVGDSADASITSGRAEPMIIVGIYNTGKTRISEYTPTKVPNLAVVAPIVTENSCSTN